MASSESQSSPRDTQEDLARRTSEGLRGARVHSAEDLLPLVYDELRRLAGARLARLQPGQTLDPTALVHEAWQRLVGPADPGWDDRAHFFGAAARAMRNVLVDAARRRGAAKRGSGQRPRDSSALEDVAGRMSGPALVDVDAALRELESFDPLKSQIVMMRFFTGLTMQEIAAALDLSLSRVEREWRFARSWLQEVLRPESS